MPSKPYDLPLLMHGNAAQSCRHRERKMRQVLPMHAIHAQQILTGALSWSRQLQVKLKACCSIKAPMDGGRH